MTPSARTAVLVVLALVTGCRDEGPVRVASIALSVSSMTMLVGHESVVTATCLAADLRELTGYPIRWGASDPSVGDVVGNGNSVTVRALGPGSTRIVASCGLDSPYTFYYSGVSGPPAASLSLIVIDAVAVTFDLDIDGSALELALAPDQGERRLVTAVARDSAGLPTPLRRVEWASDRSDLVHVSDAGLLTAIGIGTANVTVRGIWRAPPSAGAGYVVDHHLVRSISVRVVEVAALAVSRDVAIVAAHWTQGAQDVDGTIPMVRHNRAAVVNVTAFATDTTTPERVILRVVNTEASLVWADTVALRPGTTAIPTFATPSAQFLVPAAVLDVAHRWEVVRDSAFGGTDRLSANDRFPRVAAGVLSIVSPPPLRVRLVPIRLKRNGNVVPTVTDSTVDHLLRITRLRFPVGEIVVTFNVPLSSEADFLDEDGGGSGGTAFFARVLGEIDAARMAHPTLFEDYWIGFLPKLPDATTQWGGMALIPYPGYVSPLMSRSSVVLGADWYASRPSAGFIVAHELGHNFGRGHAPCGNPSGVDYQYTPSNGRVGQWVHHTTVWEAGLTDSAPPVSENAADIMSYCHPQMVGPYTYRGILNFRRSVGAALTVPAPRVRVLAVRGTVGSSGVRIHSTTTLDGVPVLASAAEGVRVELLGSGDRVLHAAFAMLGQFGEELPLRPFVAQIPLTDALDRDVRAVRVRTADASARAARAP